MYQSEKNIPKLINYPTGASGNFCISLSLLVLNFGSTKTTLIHTEFVSVCWGDGKGIIIVVPDLCDQQQNIMGDMIG